MARSPNIVMLMADQHRADVLGCAGHRVVRTPHIDELATQGVRFLRVNCQGPLCMPARASILTERYVRDHGVFENRSEVDADAPTYLHALREAGYHNAVIGKTHLWQHGFAKGTDHAASHAPKLERWGFDDIDETVGKLASVRHDSSYTEHLAQRGLLETYREHTRARNYMGGPGGERRPMWDATPMPLPLDAYVDVWHGQRAADWIESYQGDAPFNLFVGFPGPHDPWDAPREAVDQYSLDETELPATIERPEVPDAGPLRGFLKAFMALSSSDTATPDRIRAVRRAYYANVTLIDQAVGRIRAALERRGWLDETWIIYTADHGEMNGEHSMFSKMVFYDPSLRVPLILRPPGGTSAREVDVLVEHMDLSATLREIAGAPDIPGSDARSLLDTVGGGPARPREISISENFGYACFETDRHKLVVHEDTLAPLQLFDRSVDPLEDRNAVDLPEYRSTVEELMDTHVRPFFKVGPRRPHLPTIRTG